MKGIVFLVFIIISIAMSANLNESTTSGTSPPIDLNECLNDTICQTHDTNKICNLTSHECQCNDGYRNKGQYNICEKDISTIFTQYSKDALFWPTVAPMAALIIILLGCLCVTRRKCRIICAKA